MAARSAGGLGPVNPLKVADLQMNALRRRVTRAGARITLSPREFDVLQALEQEPGRALSRTERGERVWRGEHEWHARTVEIFVARLHKKSGPWIRCPAHLDRSRRRPRPSCSGVNEPVPADER